MAQFLQQKPPTSPGQDSKRQKITGTLKLSPSKSQNTDENAFKIKSMVTTTAKSKLFFLCLKINDVWKYAIGGTGRHDFFGRIPNLSESIFLLSETGEIEPGILSRPDGESYMRKISVQIFNENNKGALQIVAVLYAEAIMLTDCMVIHNENFLRIMVKTFCEDVAPSFIDINNALTFPKPGEADEMIRLCQDACVQEDIVTDIGFMTDFVSYRIFSTVNIELNGDFETAYNKIKDHTIYKDMHTLITHDRGWRYIKPFLPLKNGTLFDFFFSQMTKT